MNIDQIHAIAIYSTPERRDHMHAQCARLPWHTTYFSAYTPANSKEYLNYADNKYPERDTALCCTRSHIAALDHLLHTTTAELLLVLEDDVVFLQGSAFLEELKSVLDAWNERTDAIDFVNLGYIPAPDAVLESASVTYSYSGGKLLAEFWKPDMQVWGAQAYIVPRKIAQEMVAYLHQPTARLAHEGLLERMRATPKGHGHAPKYVRMQADAVLSLGWRQAIVDPLLVIEYPFSSLITPGDSNAIKSWSSVCTSGKRRVGDFLGMDQYMALAVKK